MQSEVSSKNAILDLSVVIVSFNVRKFLEECLHSLYKTTKDIQFEVFVVDNQSKDGTVQMLKTEFPNVNLIVNQENLGFVKANNIAFKKSRGKYILMLNPDTVIVQNSFGQIIDYFEQNTKIGAIGCKMLNSDRTLQPSCYNFPSLREIFGLYFLGNRIFNSLKKINYDKTQVVDFVRGAFMAINRQCLEEIGLLDEKFFMFAEESDLCYRMKKNGWKVVYMPDIEIIHHRGKSTEQVSDKMYLQRIRSLIYFFQKNYGKSNMLLLRVIIFFGVGLRLLLRKLIEMRNKILHRKTISKETQIEVLKLTLGLTK